MNQNEISSLYTTLPSSCKSCVAAPHRCYCRPWTYQESCDTRHRNGESMSPRSQQPRRLLHPWLKRVKAERSGFPSFFFLSIVIYAAFLWRFSFISRHGPRPFTLSKIAIVAGLADEVEAFPSAEPTQTRASQSTRAVRKSASPGVHTPTSSRSEASPSAGNTPTGGESSVGSGNVNTDSGGIGFAGQGSATGA